MPSPTISLTQLVGGLTVAAGGGTPPPGLNGALQQYDYNTVAINARFKDARDIRDNRTWLESLVNYTLLGQDRLYAGPGQVNTFGINPERLRTRPPLVQDWEASGEPTPLVGLDSFYGAPGESQAIDWTQFGPPLVYIYKPREKNYIHTEPEVNQNPLWLIGKDTFYGAQGESQAVDWTQFGLPKNFAQSLKAEKSFAHSASDVWVNPLIWLIGQDQIYAGPGQVNTFGVTERLRIRPPLIQDYLVPGGGILIGQDVFYLAPGQTMPPDWTQFGIPYKFLRILKDEQQARHSENDVWVNPLNLLIGADAFYGAPGQAITWGITERYRKLPLERLLQDWRYALVTTTLVGQDTFYGGAGQAITFGGSERLRTRPPLIQDIAQTLSTFYIGYDIIYGDPGQSISYLFQPSSPPLKQRGVAEGGLSPNLLSNLLGITSIPGVQQFDASIIRLKPTLQDIASTGLVLNLLAGLDTFYGDQGQVITFGGSQRLLVRGPLLQDWQITGTPNPNAIPSNILNPGLQIFDLTPRGYAPIPKDYIIQGLVNGVLLAQDAFYGANGQVITFGITERLRTRPPLHQDYQARGGEILIGADQFYGDSGQAVTFGITERLRRLAPLIQDYLKNGGPIPLEILGPGIVAAEPLPLRRNPLIQDYAQSLILSTLLGQDVIYYAPGEAPVYDWPLPLIKGRSIDLRTWIAQHLNDTLTGQDSFFGASGQSITFGITERLRSRLPLSQDYILQGMVNSTLLEAQPTRLEIATPTIIRQLRQGDTGWQSLSNGVLAPLTLPVGQIDTQPRYIPIGRLTPVEISRNQILLLLPVISLLVTVEGIVTEAVLLVIDPSLLTDSILMGDSEQGRPDAVL